MKLVSTTEPIPSEEINPNIAHFLSACKSSKRHANELLPTLKASHIGLRIIAIICLWVFSACLSYGQKVSESDELRSLDGSSVQPNGVLSKKEITAAPSQLRLKKVKISDDHLEKLHVEEGSGSVAYIGEKKIDLNLPGRTCFGYSVSPGKKLLLADYGEFNPVVYKANGEKIIEITYPKGNTVRWRWLNDKELVGVYVEEDRSKSQRGSESENHMLVPSIVQLYRFRVEGAPQLALIDIPKMKPGHFVQLDGVTNEGKLILSSTTSEFYDQGGYLEQLGVFEIED